MCCPWILSFHALWRRSAFGIVESSEAHRFTTSLMLAGPFDMFDSTNTVLIQSSADSTDYCVTFSVLSCFVQRPMVQSSPDPNSQQPVAVILVWPWRTQCWHGRPMRGVGPAAGCSGYHWSKLRKECWEGSQSQPLWHYSYPLTVYTYYITSYISTCHIHVKIYIYNTHVYTHTDIQTYRHADMQTYRHTDIQTYRHTYIHTGRQADRQTDIQTYRQTTYIHTHCIHTVYTLYTHTVYIHTDRQTYRQTYRHTYTHIYIYIYIYIYTLYIYIDMVRREDTWSVCIYIYIGIVWLRAPNESRPFDSSWTRTLLGGCAKRAQLLWNVHNFLQTWTTSMNSMTSSQTLQKALNQTIPIYIYIILYIMHIDILRLGHPVLHSPGRGALALFVAVYAADLRKKGASGPAPGAASKIGCQLPAISHRRGRSWKMFCISDHSAGETKWPQKTSSQEPISGPVPRTKCTGTACVRPCAAWLLG